MKSAVLARASGARRVVGFSIWHLREKSARPFYSDGRRSGANASHVIRKNLRLLSSVRHRRRPASSFRCRGTRVAGAAMSMRTAVAGRPFALINPGAAWPNKRWPAGAVRRGGARFCARCAGCAPFVLWGPARDDARADVVVERRRAPPRLAPPTTHRRPARAVARARR